MSGVIDQNGVQWEHCSHCTDFIRIERLGYVKPCSKFPDGADICANCVSHLLRLEAIKFNSIVPAPTWKRAMIDR